MLSMPCTNPNAPDSKPLAHRIIRNVGTTACLKCHNSNHVGADYVGLFEKDSERGFRSPFVQGKQPPGIYGSEQHRLTSDIHFQAGMGCTDCHILDEIHGTGQVPKSVTSGVGISCESCHVSGSHPAIIRKPDGVITLATGGGRNNTQMECRADPSQSERAGKTKMFCLPCCMVIPGLWPAFDARGESGLLEMGGQAAQNDPQVQELLYQNIGTEAELIPKESGARPAATGGSMEASSYERLAE